MIQSYEVALRLFLFIKSRNDVRSGYRFVCLRMLVRARRRWTNVRRACIHASDKSGQSGADHMIRARYLLIIAPFMGILCS